MEKKYKDLDQRMEFAVRPQMPEALILKNGQRTWHPVTLETVFGDTWLWIKENGDTKYISIPMDRVSPGNSPGEHRVDDKIVQAIRGWEGS